MALFPRISTVMSIFASTREREDPFGLAPRPLFPERTRVPGSWGDQTLDRVRAGKPVGDFELFLGGAKPDKKNDGFF